MTFQWPRRLVALAGLLLAGGCGVPTPQPDAASATPSPDPTARGAAVPWIEYEAESGATNGIVLPPSREFGEIAAESSGRSAVELSAAGQYVELVASAPANSIVLRYVIPDAPAGGGIDATLSLYVDGTFRHKLALTSKYAWWYGGEAQTLNDPQAGGAHHFYDEARSLIGDIPAGAKLRLQRDADDSAAYYVLDLVDLEQVAPPGRMPAGWVSIADCGAAPDDDADDSRAIRDCVARAKAQGTGVWLPPGRWHAAGKPESDLGIAVSDVTIAGAGMWHSTVYGPWARFHCTGNGCRYRDFAVLGETTTRDDKVPENGFNGGAGKGSRMENVWVEHTKVGWWVGAGSSNVTDGLVITGSRFRNLFADGVNLCNGSSNSIVEQSHFRNTGDDALASWAPSFDGGVNTNNLFRYNTVQSPWRANCFALYGGKDNRVENNICADVVTYPGILIAQQFDAWPFEGTTTIQRNTLIRAGGRMWNEEHGALKLHAKEGAMRGIVVRDLVIDSPTFAGLQIEGPLELDGASFENISVVDAGTDGISIAYNALGSAAFAAVEVSNPAEDGLRDRTSERFKITRQAGNNGW